jgi:hypothetical protein
MARIRSIKPEMRTSITVSLWPREVRYFFILLWGYLDDYGRGVDDELLIASDCFPRDRDITPERVDAWLELIADSGPVCRYEVDGRRYLHAPNWREHQKPSHPTRSKVPPCPEDEPEDFKTWRARNPQRLRNRSRKSREGFESFPEGLPGTSQTPSGVPPRAVSDPSPRDVYAPSGEGVPEESWSDEPAGQGGYEEAPESLANGSGNAPDSFAPEQGSKGAREQGVKPPSAAPESNRPTVVQTGGGIPDRMTGAFMKRFARGNSYGSRKVRQVVDEALGNGTDPDELWAALVRIGGLSKPVTPGTLQFAFAEIRAASNVTPIRPSTTDARVAAGLALAEKYRAEEERAALEGAPIQPQESA